MGKGNTGKTKKKRTSVKPGRPKAVINRRLVYRLARWGATWEEIADIHGEISVSTLKRHCAEEYARGLANMKKSLRRSQYIAATRNGSSAMLIWLGKQFLGQVDKVETKHTGANIMDLIGGLGYVENKNSTVGMRDGETPNNDAANA